GEGERDAEAVLEDLLDGAGEAQEGPAGPGGAGRGGALEDGDDLAVVDAGDDGCAHDADGNAGLGEGLEGAEAAIGGGGPGLDGTGGGIVGEGDAEAEAEAGVLGEGEEQIDVALDEGALGNEADGVLVLDADFEALARELEVVLDGLVAVGDAGEHDELAG